MKNDNHPALQQNHFSHRLKDEESLKALESLFENMSNQNIIDELKEQFDRDGYKGGFCDGFRAAIRYVKNGL